MISTTQGQAKGDFLLQIRTLIRIKETRFESCTTLERTLFPQKKMKVLKNPFKGQADSETASKRKIRFGGTQFLGSNTISKAPYTQISTQFWMSITVSQAMKKNHYHSKTILRSSIHPKFKNQNVCVWSFFPACLVCISRCLV